MRRRWIALIVVAFAGAGIGVTYAIDAAFPDKYRPKPIDVAAVSPRGLALPTGTVDYAEFGYPAKTTAGTPELRVYAHALTAPVVSESTPLRIKPADIALLAQKDDSIVWIWLVVAGALCAVMAAMAVILWRRRRTQGIAL